ncbi:MAG: 2,3-bisphosphoglycerate-dependent phosphoglycerate mutase [Gammaproteobacteria bacterium]|nr:2,3-bisphosphoglycerate-dependent phosphoglycerate mutase [Gammaproteobacteria bacterium]MBU1978707.1 2,3-bisphosphoglycerate-dependent phosphoglycerate mutase [Gammaproteobacteria bacterium]
MKEAERLLVLVRHGSSDWNLTSRFTGWTDIPLTEQGVAQAAAAGRRLAAEGLVFDEVHTSVLQRTHQTADSLLAAACHASIPRYSSWRLNERHYGQLQGLVKQEIFSTWGEQNSRRWWRGYFEPPPPLELSDPRYPGFDPLYADIDTALLPRSESLSDCQQRLLPYWHEVLAPRLTANLRLLVISHGNTLRSLIMHLEKITPDAIEQVEVPSGVPLVYRFNNRLEIVGREWLE